MQKSKDTKERVTQPLQQTISNRLSPWQQKVISLAVGVYLACFLLVFIAALFTGNIYLFISILTIVGGLTYAFKKAVDLLFRP